MDGNIMLKEFKFKSSDESRVFVVSDTHFNHEKIVEKRGYKSLTEHDAGLIKTWNERVRPQDTVLHLGDFVFRANEELAKHYINQLNGVIYYVWGNHSSGVKQLYHKLLGEFHTAAKVEIYPTTYFLNTKPKFIFVGNYMYGWINSTPFVASHFPFRIWDFMQRNAVALSGHSHSSDKKSNPDWPRHKRIDCGIENFGGPVSFDDLMVILNKKEFVQLDHHDKNTSSSF